MNIFDHININIKKFLTGSECNAWLTTDHHRPLDQAFPGNHTFTLLGIKYKIFRHFSSVNHLLYISMAGLVFFLAVLSGGAAHLYHHGYHHLKHPKCTKEIETVTKEFCRLEFEKTCKTETKTFFKITGFEDKDCKDIEVCKHGELIVDYII